MNAYRARRFFLANGSDRAPGKLYKGFVYVLSLIAASIGFMALPGVLGILVALVLFVFMSVLLRFRYLAFQSLVGDMSMRATIGIGKDGITFSRMIGSSFIPWSQVRGFEVEQKRGRNGIVISLARHVGARVKWIWFMIEGSPAEIVLDVRRQCPRLRSPAKLPVDRAEWVELLAREERLPPSELTNIYRRSELSDDALYALLDHPDVDRDLRVRAANVLRIRIEQEGGMRLAAFQERIESLADDMANEECAEELRAIVK